jgi:cytosine permease
MTFSEAGAALSAWRPVQTMSYIQGITLVVGAWAMGFFTCGDFVRYAKRPRLATAALTAGLAPAIPAVLLGGAILRVLTGTHDITAVLSEMGFPSMALVFLILATWMINITNVYSGGIALSVLSGLPEKRLMPVTALAGGVGTILGAAGILSLFTGFLSLLSSLVPPVTGVLMGARIADGLKRRGGGRTETAAAAKSAEEDALMKPGFHLPGIVAYAAGALIAWLTGAVYPFFIPPLNGIVIAAAVYVLMNNIFTKQGKYSTI